MTGAGKWGMKQVFSRVLKNIQMGGAWLFKNAQMQGAQKQKSEAYMEIRRAMRFAAQRSR
jgi:hypothetical protein